MQCLNCLGHRKPIEVFPSSVDRKICTTACYRNIEITVEIGQVKQTFDVISGKIALSFKLVVRCQFDRFIQLIFAHVVYRHFFFFARFALTGC